MFKTDSDRTMMRVRGLAIGLVSNNQDPEKLGRVKLLLPWMGETVESHWARVVQPMAGKGRGFWFLPEVGDECLLSFEHGEITRPMVLGVLWNEKDKPPSLYDVFCPKCVEDPSHLDSHKGAFNADGKNDKKYMRSRSGHMIVFDDNSGLTVSDKTGKHRFDLKTEDKKVVLTNGDGSSLLNSPNGSLSLDAKEIEIQVLGDATFGAKTDMKIKSKGKLSLDSRDKVDIHGGANAYVNASGGPLIIQGSRGAVTGSAQFGCEAGGDANLFASGPVQVQGMPVGLQMPPIPVIVTPLMAMGAAATAGAALGMAGSAGAAPMVGMQAASAVPNASADQALQTMGAATGTAVSQQASTTADNLSTSAGTSRAMQSSAAAVSEGSQAPAVSASDLSTTAPGSVTKAADQGLNQLVSAVSSEPQNMTPAAQQSTPAPSQSSGTRSMSAPDSSTTPPATPAAKSAQEVADKAKQTIGQAAVNVSDTASDLKQQKLQLAEDIAAGNASSVDSLVKTQKDSVQALRDTTNDMTKAVELSATRSVQAQATPAERAALAELKDKEEKVAKENKELVDKVAEASLAGDRKKVDKLLSAYEEKGKSEVGEAKKTIEKELKSLGEDADQGRKRALTEVALARSQADKEARAKATEIRGIMESTRQKCGKTLDGMDKDLNKLKKNLDTAAGQMDAARKARMENAGKSSEKIKKEMLQSLRTDIQKRITPEGRAKAEKQKAIIRAHVTKPAAAELFTLNEDGFWTPKEDADPRLNLPE